MYTCHGRTREPKGSGCANQVVIFTRWAHEGAPYHASSYSPMWKHLYFVQITPPTDVELAIYTSFPFSTHQHGIGPKF